MSSDIDQGCIWKCLETRDSVDTEPLPIDYVNVFIKKFVVVCYRNL